MSSTDVENYSKKVQFVLSKLSDKQSLRKQIRMQFILRMVSQLMNDPFSSNKGPPSPFNGVYNIERHIFSVGHMMSCFVGLLFL